MPEADVLLVEDNHADVHLIEQLFEERELPGRLHTVQTGAEALDWLYQRDGVSGLPRPDLVLLDLNLPETSGHDVLAAIEDDPELARIPVVVLTGAQSDRDIAAAYERHANACLIKPIDPDEFGEHLEHTMAFWVCTAALPSHGGTLDNR